MVYFLTSPCITWRNKKNTIFSFHSNAVFYAWDFRQSLLDFFNLVDSLLIFMCDSLNLIINGVHCWGVKVKVAHTWLESVGFRRWSRFLAVSLQVMWVINPAVGCHYFPPGLQLPPQPLRGLLPILLLGEQRHNGCEEFAKTVTRQRRGCDLNPGHSAPESSMLTTHYRATPVKERASDCVAHIMHQCAVLPKDTIVISNVFHSS